MMEHRPPDPRQPAVRDRLVGLCLIVILAIATACADAEPNGLPTLPTPTCGGLKIAIPGALPCEQVVRIAVETLDTRAPDQIARGVTAIDVNLVTCPRGEVPPQIDCRAEQFAQLVTVTFGPGGAGGMIEPSLTVAVAPVSGAVLGISNPLIR